MSVALDLRYRAWTKVHGDLTFIGSWMREENSQFTSVMVIVRTGEESSDHNIPCIVPVTEAWRWSEELGDPRGAARTTAEFLEALRMSFTKRNAIRLTSLIHDHIGDLLAIPPFASLGVEQVVTADLIRIDHGTGEITEQEIRDYV